MEETTDKFAGLLIYATKAEKRRMLSMLVAKMIDDPRDISEGIGMELPSTVVGEVRDHLRSYDV